MPKARESLIPEASEQVRLFHISVPQEAVDDLRARLRATRVPNEQPVKDWSQGVPLAQAKALLQYIGNLNMTGTLRDRAELVSKLSDID